MTRWVVLLVVVAVVGMTVPAMAQSEPGAEQYSDEAGGPPQKTYGASPTNYQIHISDFTARNGASTWTYLSAGRVTRATGADLVWAPVQLPNGAVIEAVEAFFEDTSAAGTATVFLTRFFGTTGIVDIGSASTVGTPGPVTTSFAPNFTVNNTTDSYVVYLALPVDAGIITKGARVRYHLQVSPPPATATFNDVPTGDSRFRFVEALVASGLTGGCGGGNYCPDTAVTRGQIAVFLSVALGLHFPN